MILELQLSPSELVFVDDRMENCRAAEEIGMQSHHFTTVHKLRGFLRERALILGETI